MKYRRLQLWAMLLMAAMVAPVFAGPEDQQVPREMYPIHREPVAPVVEGKLKWVEPPAVENQDRKPGQATYRGTRGHGFTLDPQGQDYKHPESLEERDEFREHPKPPVVSQ